MKIIIYNTLRIIIKKSELYYKMHIKAKEYRCVILEYCDQVIWVLL